jgi:hypothetical protein
MDLLLALGLVGSETDGVDRSVLIISVDIDASDVSDDREEVVAGFASEDGSAAACEDGVSGLSGVETTMCDSVTLANPMLADPAHDGSEFVSDAFKATNFPPAALEGAEVEASKIADLRFEVAALEVQGALGGEEGSGIRFCFNLSRNLFPKERLGMLT